MVGVALSMSGRVGFIFCVDLGLGLGLGLGGI